MPKVKSSRAARALAFVAIAALPLAAAAQQVFYKWIDAQGKVQYGDKPPKNFTGPVTRIEIEPPAPVRMVPAAREEIEATVAEQKTPDIGTKRRMLREALEADLERARTRLATAKAALAEAVPGDTERQVIQQRADQRNPRPGPGSASTGGGLGTGGMHGNAAKQNCRTVKGSDGKTVMTCPTIVPAESFYERVRTLEEDVRKAEEDVAAAEQAYRRGVD